MEFGLSLGSNLGDRATNLIEAKRRILSLPGVKGVAQSPLYETEPVGVKPEYKDLQFLNSVLVVESTKPVGEFHQLLAGVERDIGRQRTVDKYAPRTVDIDLIYAGDETIDRAGLKIPHPLWAKRRFVVHPLADVRPDLVLPGSAKPVHEILAALPAGEGVKVFQKEW
jgi:2-amino-4-hydroxy-6-hydroxymethyldihydropteridine diphosphokinase